MEAANFKRRIGRRRRFVDCGGGDVDGITARYSGRRRDKFDSVVRCKAEARSVNKHSRCKGRNSRNSVSGRAGNGGNVVSASGPKNAFRCGQFPRVGKHEALQQPIKRSPGKVGIEPARSGFAGFPALATLARRVDKRTGRFGNFPAEIGKAVRFGFEPLGVSRQLTKAFFFRKGKFNFVTVAGFNFAFGHRCNPSFYAISL